MAIEVLAIEGGVCAPQGFRAGSAYASIRKVERDDIAVIVSDVPAAAAGVFTTNTVSAWCVQNGREKIKRQKAQAIVANAGNANACNGQEGNRADGEMARIVARELGISEDLVLTASTGVIGRPLPINRARDGIAEAARRAMHSEEANLQAARAIMTTDLVHKSKAVEVKGKNGTYRIGGIAKGSGMIAPNMATMLAFITCDAVVRPELLQNMLSGINEMSFNRVSVDSDTSTNDLVYLLANGASGVTATQEDLVPALAEVMVPLAKKVARDGEGATKLVEVMVFGDYDEMDKAARAVAESPLVKTALFGNDPNWGRILMALGKSGAKFDPNKIKVSIAGRLVFAKGMAVPVDLDDVSNAMKAEEVLIEIDLGHRNPAVTRFWTCDFSYDYVKINADYRS